MINCIIKPTRCTFFNFILITSSTCFEKASYPSSAGNFTVHAVYGMYHAENTLKLFKLYRFIKSKNHIVYKITHKMLILKYMLLKAVAPAPHERYVQHFSTLYEPAAFSGLLLATYLLILTFYI